VAELRPVQNVANRFAIPEEGIGSNDVLFLRRGRATPLVAVVSRSWAAILDAPGFAVNADGRSDSPEAPP
jgi:hypothetical protein